MDDKITIIEGPPPTFEPIQDGWAMGLNEGPFLYDTMITHLRTFSGPALVERCHRAWHDQSHVYLEFRNDIGLQQRAPILAARSMTTDEGNVLILWVRQEPQDASPEIDQNDDEDSDNLLD